MHLKNNQKKKLNNNNKMKKIYNNLKKNMKIEYKLKEMKMIQHYKQHHYIKLNIIFKFNKNQVNYKKLLKN